MEPHIRFHGIFSILSEEADLTCIGQVAEGACVLEHLQVGLGNLGAGGGKFLDGEELLALPAVHDIPGRTFAEARNGHEGGQNFAVLDEELGGVGLVDVDGRKVQTPEVELVE